MQKLPCVVIRDLLPSYVDGLTSAETNELIQAHLAECADCQARLQAMQEPTPSLAEDEKEIDFLKKNRKKNIRILIGSLLGCVLLAAGAIGLKTFVIGAPSTRGMVACEVQVTEGKTLNMEGMVVDSAHAISKIDVQEEENGVIRVQTRTVVANPLYASGDFRTAFNAQNEIHQVWLDGRIVWENGTVIPQRTFDLFETRHDYIGDMPANGRLARVLEIDALIGAYENELETGEEPYTWRFLLLEDRQVKEKDLEEAAYVLLGLVENLSQVTFEGDTFSKTVTAEEASAFLGQNIKDCGQSVSVLQKLLQK